MNSVPTFALILYLVFLFTMLAPYIFVQVTISKEKKLTQRQKFASLIIFLINTSWILLFSTYFLLSAITFRDLSRSEFNIGMAISAFLPLILTWITFRKYGPDLFGLVKTMRKSEGIWKWIFFLQPTGKISVGVFILSLFITAIVVLLIATRIP